MRLLAWFMKFVRIGRILNTHGLDGELVMQLLTDSPEILDDMQYMMLAVKGDVKASLEIEYMQDFKSNLLVAFKGVDGIDEAKKYKGMDVVVPEEMLPELEDEIYWSEFQGALVFDRNGEQIGTLVDYMEGGGADIFRIKCADGYYLVSNNIDHVLEIDVKNKKLVVDRVGLVSEEI
jgi:16S rRNA processing protein RimM